MTGAVMLQERARRAHGLAVAELPLHAVVVGDVGEVLRVEADGSLTFVPAPGHPRSGIASDACARRGTP